jgi:1-acyl-sn-glycerol-3-phosphate acyltransferase
VEPKVVQSHTLRQNPTLSAIGKLYYKLSGWRLEGDMPDIAKSVITVAPHTSNWDFIVFLMGSFVLGIRGQWLGKDAIFIGPLGWLWRKLGGIALDRSSSHNLIEQAAAAFDKSTAMALVLAPEGTRKKTDHWKSGFYYIALRANVPILLAYADYKRKCAGIGPMVWPTGDVEADLAKIRAFYADITPRYPEHRSDVRFRA